MAGAIPFVPSRNNYRLTVPIGNQNYLFDNIHWTGRDGEGAWYFDLRQEDLTPILLDAKVLINASIGRTSTHKFFKENLLRVVSTNDDQTDARYDDLGGRIQVLLTTSQDTVPEG